MSTDPCPPSLGAPGSLRCLVCQENSSAPVPTLLGQCLASHSFQHGEAAQRWGAGGSSALECALSCVSPPKALRHRSVPVSELVSDTATLRLLTEASFRPQGSLPHRNPVFPPNLGLRWLNLGVQGRGLVVGMALWPVQRNSAFLEGKPPCSAALPAVHPLLAVLPAQPQELATPWALPRVSWVN